MADITIPQLDPLANIPDEAILYVVVDGVDYRTTKGEFLSNINSGFQKTVTSNITLDNSYNNTIVKVKGTATITVPAGLVNNFNCVFDVWAGATATFNTTAVTLNSSIGTTLIAGKMATLYQDESTNVYRLRGELS